MSTARLTFALEPNEDSYAEIYHSEAFGSAAPHSPVAAGAAALKFQS
jgi:hypothetical protein